MLKNFVYIIRGKNIYGRTKFYIGFTNNLYRRIRQHNGELVGGAKATKGYKWQYCGIITHFRDHIEGLQIEWRLKYSSKQKNIVNRINSFFSYIDTNLKASPKSDKINKKLFIYLNHDLLPINKNNYIKKPNNIIIFKTDLSEVIIDHLMI